VTTTQKIIIIIIIIIRKYKKKTKRGHEKKKYKGFIEKKPDVPPYLGVVVVVHEHTLSLSSTRGL
jgi:hypothetical protein